MKKLLFSFDFFARRFIAFTYNFLFAVLSILCFCIVGVVLSGILALIFGDWPLSIALIFVLISPIATFLLISYKTSQGRQTPGSKELGIAVVDKDGKHLSFSKSLVRNLLWVLSALPLGIGIIWTIFNRSGQGWPDLILSTKVVNLEKEGEVKIPKLAFVSFVLGLLSLLMFVFPFATMSGSISSVTVVWLSLVVLFIIIPLTFILGIISRAITRKKEKDLWGKKLANYSIRIAVISGVLFILTAIAIPSNRYMFALNQEIKCKREMKEIAEVIERYIHIKKEYPENLNELVKSGYLSVIPEFQYHGEYIYKVETNNGQKYYIIECPEPKRLLKGRGLLPPKRCLELKYIQEKGFIVGTE